MSALHGLRIIDIGGSVATSYCGKLFAAFGAEVINVEPSPCGNPTRLLPPLQEAAEPVEASGFASYLDAGKRSLALDLGEPHDRATLRRLCRGADVVLDAEIRGRRDALDLADLGFDDNGGDAAGPIHASLTWFGQDGPYCGQAAVEATLHALVGTVRNFGPVAGPPVPPSGQQIQILGGTTAFVAILAQLIGRLTGAAGGRVSLDISLFEAALCLVEPGAVSAYNSPDPPQPRLGINRFWPTFPAGIYPCRDGWIGVTVVQPTQWRSFCQILGIPEIADDPRYALQADRHAAADELDAIFTSRLQSKDAEEWFHLGQQHRVPLALVPTMEALLTCEQFTQRQAFVRVEHPDQGSFLAPGTPFRLERTPATPDGGAPRLGESRAEDIEDRAEGPVPPVHGSDAQPGSLQPLAGLRIVDLAMGWAGPLAARHLADLGAEVIKVESCRHFDWWRGWEVTPEVLADNGLEKAWPFQTVNRNKLDVTLDLTTDAGADLLRRLVAGADAVVENFAGSVLPKLGLGYDELRQTNDRLVMLSMPPFGATGPWRSYRAYGSTVEQASGLPHLQGEEDWPPAMQHVALGDPVAGLNGAAALMVGLWHRLRAGEGQKIDLSHVECLFPFAAQGLIEQSMNGRRPRRRGRRHPTLVPQGIYPCLGDDRWVAVAAAAAQWEALAEATGGVLDDSIFATGESRRRHEDQLDERLAAWTSERREDEVVGTLQSAGIAAAPVRLGADLLDDPHLEATGFWQWLEGDIVGLQPNPSPPYRCNGKRFPVRSAAPTLGQHNRQVLGGILGLDAKAIEDLHTAGIIGSVAAVSQD